MFTASNGSAVATCALMTPYWFLSSSSAAGTMLKLAAIGVIRAQVPTAIPLLIANILILYLAGFHL